jgi:hypothetical protein
MSFQTINPATGETLHTLPFAVVAVIRGLQGSRDFRI